jgi:hypothetical protein
MGAMMEIDGWILEMHEGKCWIYHKHGKKQIGGTPSFPAIRKRRTAQETWVYNCWNCGMAVPSAILGFSKMVEWER